MTTSERKPFELNGELVKRGMLLEASAGTGKTYSMANLVVRLVAEERVPIDEILAVTFTNAATAELRERFRDRLSKALQMLEEFRGDLFGPADPVLGHILNHARTAGHWANVMHDLRQAIESFDRAQISTIHGFCQRMLQQNALASGAAFETQLVDDERAVIREVVEDFWLRELFRAPLPVLSALEPLGIDLAAAVSLGVLAVKHPDAEVVPADPDVAAPPEMPGIEAARDALAEVWERDADRVFKLVDDAAYRRRLDPDVYTRDAVRGAKRALWQLAKGSLSRQDVEAARYFDGRMVRAHALPGQAPVHPVFELVSAYRHAWIGEVKGALDFALSFRHRLVAHARAEVVRRREARGERSYDDLLRILRDALTDPSAGGALAATIRRQYKAVLIDEFQDTDPVQWAIFDSVFGGSEQHWLYLIGDPKQAIYRFRGADIHTYLEAQRKLGERVATLTTSYRADRRLVRAQNALFGAADGAFAHPEIAYHQVAHHHDDDRFPDADAAIRVRFVPREGKSRTIKSDFKKRELPRRVAADIARTLHARPRIRDGEAYRDVRPRDCAVLVRTNPQAREIQAALREWGIPSVLHGPDSVFKTEEADELERLLAAILEPSRTGLARTGLATTLMGESAESIELMAQDSTRWEGWVGQLRGWQRMWQEHSFIHMFRGLLSGRITHLLRWTDGERRMANLLHLGELLHRASVEEELEPAGLLDWLRQSRRDPGEAADALQLRLESDADAVEVVTIHKSKGLQYPLVWCPFLWQREKDWGRKSQLVFRDPAADWAERIDIGPDFKDWAAHQGQVDYELAAEGLRLMYVAVTRASHQVTLWWGAFWEADKSPLWYLLNRTGAACDAETLEAALGRGLGGWNDERLQQRIRALEQTSEGAIKLEEERAEDVPPWRAEAPSAERLEVQVYRRSAPIENLWRRTSFSGLTRDVPFEPDHAQSAADEVTDEDGAPAAIAAAAAEERIALADMPGGRSTGNFLHKVLELADFQDGRDVLQQIVADQAPRHGLDAEWVEPVSDALITSFGAPLGATAGSLRLGDLPLERRFNELDFTMPLAGGAQATGPELDPARLAEVFARHDAPTDWAHRLGQLPFKPARGFLTGSIDLVFTDEAGRWYLADYKSNHLGARVADYAPPSLARAMAHHHYFLQYHLYVVGLARYLAWRVPGWDYERDFGGVYYLFLRGMGTEYPAGTGIYFDRPDVGLVEALARRLTEGV